MGPVRYNGRVVSWRAAVGTLALLTACATAERPEQGPGALGMQGDAGDEASSGIDLTTSITAASADDGDSADDGSGGDDDDDDADGDDDDDGSTTSGGDAESTDGGDESSVDATAGPAGSTGGGAEGSSGGGGESTGESLMCEQMDTCAAAAGLGSVSGDEGSPILEFEGWEPRWLEFQVTENNDDIIGEELTFTVTLTSPPGYDFDIYVERGLAGASAGCGGIAASSISVGAVDTVSMDWGEDLIPNGVSDTSWISVEIVPKDDVCDPAGVWTLEVEGDT